MLTDAGVIPSSLHDASLQEEHYADLEDYVRAVASVWGEGDAAAMVSRIAEMDRYAREPCRYIISEGSLPNTPPRPS